MANYESRSLSAALVIVLLSQIAFGQWPEELQRASARIIGSILIEGRSMDYVQDLSDKFGARLAGSSAHQQAAQWAAAQFRAAGIKKVRLEPFTILHGWERGWARAQMLTPIKRHLYLEPMGWTPSTPPQGVNGKVVLVSDISPEGIKAQARKIKGQIVMLDMSGVTVELFYTVYGRYLASFQLLHEAGAVAVLLPDREPSNVLNANEVLYGTDVPPLPVAQVGMEDAKLMRRLIERGSVTIEFQYENRVTGPVQVNNVIAEIEGREQADEWVIVGAHLDSWDYGTGAQDNGTGCAMVLEAARVIAALGQAPRRSIRFALWGCEEPAYLGSVSYIRAHSTELEKCVAVLNTDHGAGQPLGWKVQGRVDLGETMKPISKSLLAGLGGDGVSQAVDVGSDHMPFMLEGIPAFNLWVDDTHYREIHHKSGDTLDKVDAHNLALGAAVVTVTAYALAERPDRIARRIDKTAVETILKKAGVEAYVKAIGLWK